MAVGNELLTYQVQRHNNTEFPTVFSIAEGHRFCQGITKVLTVPYLFACLTG